MRISDSHQLLFVHVQKTGGVSMERVLAEHIPDLRQVGPARHYTLSQILKWEPELRTYWIVGFVRNPWARMLSWWSMIRDVQTAVSQGVDSVGTRQMTRNRFWQAVAKYPDFETFLDRGPQEHKRLRRPQVEYLSTRTRRADFIGRTESYEADVRAVLARLGYPVPTMLPHANRSEHGSYRDHYSPAARDRVAEVFRKDIDAFGYEF